MITFLRNARSMIATHKNLLGMAVGFCALTPLTTTFGLFHVDTFLIAYELPLASYATGNAIYAFINTANDVGGAWLVDRLAQRSNRSGILSITGYLYALSFLTIFFRFDRFLFGSSSIPPSWPLIHLIVSMSLYDTMYSFSAILTGSIFTDDPNMNRDTKVKFMACARFCGMVLSFGLAKFGLKIFDPKDLSSFRLYVIVVAIFAAFLFRTSESLMQASSPMENKKNKSASNSNNLNLNKDLSIKTAIRDLFNHTNFRRWIIMEMFLECQTNFTSSFSKLFVDRLLSGAISINGFSKETCDWILSIAGPTTRIVALLLYIPIRQFGYQNLYLLLFRLKFFLALWMILFITPAHKYSICFFLLSNKVITGAVQGSGFALAMADLVTEMKYNHIKQQRLNEPSLAGMFMGANALMCKPMDSFLPIIAAWSLDRAGFVADTQDVIPSTEISDVEWTLFYLLIGPSLIFSPLQYYFWRKYDLDGNRAEEMNKEIQRAKNTSKEII